MVVLALLEYEQLSEWLLKQRNRQGYSQQQIADMAHMSKAAVAGAERTITPVKVNTAQPYAKVLGYRIKIAIVPYEE